jgi:hypothetical protein
LDPTASQAEGLYDTIQALALSLVFTLVQTRWLMVMQQGRSLPLPFLIVLGVLVFWLTMIFFSFGLLAPPTPPSWLPCVSVHSRWQGRSS